MSKKLNMLLKAQLEQNTSNIYDLKHINYSLYESHKDILDKFNIISIRMMSVKTSSKDLSISMANSLRDYAESSENLSNITNNLTNFSNTITTSKDSLDTIIADCNNLISNEHDSVLLIKKTAELTETLNNSIVGLESAVTTLSKGAKTT